MVASVVAGGILIPLQAWIASHCWRLRRPNNTQPRIVSTFPSVTETLFALGAGDRVVGVSSYCRYPPAVLSLPKVGSYTKPDPEKIALLRPDLVIIQRTATTLADRLNALGIPYTQVKVGSLDEIYSLILDVGRAVGFPDRADKSTPAFNRN
jgi:iron complex transport system substrate-binding protein